MSKEASMQGKVCLITGANSGIGKSAATGLARLGAHVVMVCRDAARGEAARAEIVRESGNEAVDLLIADLSSQAEIRRLADEVLGRYDRLDVLVNNAGVINGTRTQTVDGLESTFALNHLAYFQLTGLLLDLLRKSAPARVVSVSSYAHKLSQLDMSDLQSERGYDSLRTYNRSKLANVLFTHELARRLQGTGVTANCLHPGAVASGFASGNRTFFGALVKLVRPFLRSPQKGADTVVYLASSPEVEGVSGKYFADRKPRRTSRQARDEALAASLWSESERLLGLV